MTRRRIPASLIRSNSQDAKSESIERVREFISQKHMDVDLRVLPPESTRTSQLAAKSLGCNVADIAKTVCFAVMKEDIVSAILVTLSGEKRVSLEKLAKVLEIPASFLRKMNADEVKSLTGYSIGGVPPFPHYEGVRVLVDESLFVLQSVWTAAGSPNSVMKVNTSVFHYLGLRRVDVSD